MDKAQVIVSIGVIVLVLGLGAWWQVYKYHDCKNVGHSTFYCIMGVGK